MTVTTIYNIIMTRIRHVTTNIGYYNIRIHIYITDAAVRITSIVQVLCDGKREPKTCGGGGEDRVTCQCYYNVF